jgi:hypothetical protein
MASTDRFYNLQLRDRPVFKGDIGSMIKISGLLVTGGGEAAVLMLPSATLEKAPPKFISLTDEEWNDFVRRSDDPEVLIEKVFKRKVQWEVQSAVQQKIYAADGFECMYCGARMGKSLLTIDHFVPLEKGGKNDSSNYLTACRKCNKDKANMEPQEWCDKKHINYDNMAQYLKIRKLP